MAIISVSDIVLKGSARRILTYKIGLIFQGFLYAAAGAGKYTILTPYDTFDDTGLIWVGDKALGNNWNYNNADFVMTLFKEPRPGQEVVITLAAGEAIPVTIFFANIDGPGFMGV